MSVHFATLATFLLGALLGGGLRWSLRSDQESDTPASTGAGKEAMSVNPLGALPETSRVAAPPPSLTDIARAPVEDYLALLVKRVATAEPPELEDLFLELQAEDRLDVLARDLIFLRWMKIDPEHGLARAQANGRLNVAYWAWAKVDPDAAMASARALGDPGMLAKVIRAVGQSDPDAGIALMDDLPESERSTAWQGILSAMTLTEPQRAMELSLKLDRLDSDNLKAWARRDPEAALTWFHDHLPAGESFYLKAAFKVLIDDDPDHAARMLARWPKTTRRATMVTEYVAEVGARDLDSAREFLNSLEPGMQDHARGRLAERLTESDPDAAFEVLSEMEWVAPPPNPLAIQAEYPTGSMKSGFEHSHESIDAIGDLMDADPERTSAFLATLPESSRTADAYARAMRRWMDKDSMAASAWLAEQPSGQRKDAAIQTMNTALMDGGSPDFEASVHWAMQMSEQESRRNLLSRVFDQWRDADPEGATQGLSIPGIPESVINRFEGERRRMKRMHILLLLTSLLGMAIGWFAAGRQAPSANSETPFQHPSLGLTRSSGMTDSMRSWVQAIQENGVPAEQSVMALSAAESIAVEDIEQMLDELEHLPAHSTRMVAKRQLLHRWLKGQPDAALKWTLTHFRTMVPQLAEAWHRTDPEAALAFAAAQTTETNRAALYGAMARGKADEDVDAMSNFLSEHYVEGKRSQFSKALRKLARRDPQGLLTRLEDFPEDLEPRSNLVEGWATTDPMAAFEWARNEDAKLLGAFFSGVKDPTAALQVLGSLSPEEQQEHAKSLQLTSRRPEELLALLDSAAGLSPETVETVRKHAEGALEIEPAPELEPPKTTEELVAELAKGNGASNLGANPEQEVALLEAMAALPDGEQVAARARYFEISQEETRFASAAAQVPYLPADDPDTLESVATLSAHWARHDPRAAADWVESLAEGDVRDWAAKNVAKQWERLDPDAAWNWGRNLYPVAEPDPNAPPQPPIWR